MKDWLSKVIGKLGLGRRLGLVSEYELILTDIGDDPQAVLELLNKDFFFADRFGGETEMPDLPVSLLVLPAGSDTFSLVHIKRHDLIRLGAAVNIIERSGV